MTESAKRTSRFLTLPALGDLLYRLPSYIGIVCCTFLLIGGWVCSGSRPQGWRRWVYGAFTQSYFVASILFYVTVISVVVLAIRWRRRRDVGGLLLVIGFLAVLAVFRMCFVDYVQGYVIWPIGR